MNLLFFPNHCPKWLKIISINSIKGLMKESKCLDKELDEYVYIVPASQNKVSFQLYMNEKDIEQAYDQQITILPSPDRLDPIDRIEQMLSSMLGENTTRVQRIVVDTDQEIVLGQIKVKDPSFDLNDSSGIVTENKTHVDVLFECQGINGTSIVELSFQLLFFKDISIYFKKECTGNSKQEGGNSFFNLLFNLVIILFFIFVFVTIFNIIYYKLVIVKAIPLLENLIGFVTNQQMFGNSVIIYLITQLNYTQRFQEKIRRFNDRNYGNSLTGSTADQKQFEIKISNLNELKEKNKSYGAI